MPAVALILAGVAAGVLLAMPSPHRSDLQQARPCPGFPYTRMIIYNSYRQSLIRQHMLVLPLHSPTVCCLSRRRACQTVEGRLSLRSETGFHTKLLLLLCLAAD